ncbi:glycosyltransferase family 1 protein [Microbacterium sp. 18062]|uniref:glycosyltransferase family 4 protein n=1 Tax=Microbacterium sp. 18062 TaxID=2681410 RepID=UPI0013593D8B|nr:glycosyltransferase family 1 protein [Microbacterium sp. 18062]
MNDRILVDLLSFTGNRGGTETYAREIATRLPKHLPDVTFVALTNRKGIDRVRSFFPGEVRLLRGVGADRVTWAAGEILGANRAARRAGAGLVWCPANFGPLTSRVPRITTVHDVTYHEIGGGAVNRAIARVTSSLMSRTALTSAEIITGSKAAGEAIVRHIGVDRERIHVVPHGTNEPPAVERPWADLDALGIRKGRPLVLSTGNRLSHKNFEGLLRAIAAIPAVERPVTVITGGGAEDPLVPLVTSLGLGGDVVLPGWVSTAQLEALYAAAELYVCPSLAEGFGLPVIDAMRRDCVVLANDIPVLREVGGAAALYTDAQSPAALSTALSAALRDPNGERRRAEGRAWSAQFTWDASAAATARVLRKALSSSKPVAS